MPNIKTVKIQAGIATRCCPPKGLKGPPLPPALRGGRTPLPSPPPVLLDKTNTHLYLPGGPWPPPSSLPGGGTCPRMGMPSRSRQNRISFTSAARCWLCSWAPGEPHRAEHSQTTQAEIFSSELFENAISSKRALDMGRLPFIPFCNFHSCTTIDLFGFICSRNAF